MPENQETLLPPRRTTRTRKATAQQAQNAPTGAETSAQASALPFASADDAMTGEPAQPRRATRARRSATTAAPAAVQDDTTIMQPAAQPAASDTSAAPARRRVTRARVAAKSATSQTDQSGESAPAEAAPMASMASIETSAAAPIRPATRRGARAEQAPSASEELAVRQPELSIGAHADTPAPSEPRELNASDIETPATPPRRRFDVRPRGPYGRAISQPPTQEKPTIQEPITPNEYTFNQPADSGAPAANVSQGGRQQTGRGAQGTSARGVMPYAPGGRGAEHHGRDQMGRQPRQPQYPQQQTGQQGPAQHYPTGNYPSGQRPQGRDEQRGGQPYTVYSPAAPYAPADPYGQRNPRGQRGQQDQGPHGQRNRSGNQQQGYQNYPEGPAQGQQGRGAYQDPRDQRRQGGRHNDQGYQNQNQNQNQNGYPADRRGGATNTRGGQMGRNRGRDQMAMPPLYTNPANAPVDPRYSPYAPPVQRNQPAPQQHARVVEVAGMVFPTGHGASTADVLDERTLQTIGRITLEDMRRWGLRSGDVIRGQIEERGSRRALVALDSVNDVSPESARERPHFDQLTATFPDRRVRLEQSARPISARIIDLFSPLGFGSRALIVAPPKTGKTTLIREAAESVLLGYPDAVVMAVLVGERPEEVTDLRSRLEPRGGHVYAASFDESTERHAWLTQVAVERAKRVAESGRDAFMVLDSLTRLARAENLASRGGGRTLSGGIDAQALDTGRRAFGAARNLEEGGSITILATCLVDTGSRQDDVVYEEFKGTGNMELHLSRELAQRRLFPAVDAIKSSTRREELLLTPEELRGSTTLRRLLADKPTQAATQWLLDAMERTPSNATLLNAIEQQTGVRAR